MAALPSGGVGWPGERERAAIETERRYQRYGCGMANSPLPGHRFEEGTSAVWSSFPPAALVAVPIGFVFLLAFAGPAPAIVITLLAGAGLAAFASETIQGWLKWHQPVVEIASKPYNLGEEAIVVYRRKPRRVTDISPSDITCEIVCEEEVHYRQGTDNEQMTRTVYSNKVSATGEGSYEGFVGEIRFTIPTHAGGPTLDMPNNKIKWHLEIRAHGPQVPGDAHRFDFTVSTVLDPSARIGVSDT